MISHLRYLLMRLPWRLAGDPEWSENWRSWPHCNGQDRCWMHYRADGGGAWCRAAHVDGAA